MGADQQSNLYKVLSERLSHYLEAGDFERAVKVAQTAIEAAKRPGADDENLPELLEALRKLGSRRVDDNDFTGAELVYQEAFSLARGRRTVSPVQIAKLKSELAAALDLQNKQDEALPLYQDAIEIFESASVDEPLLAANLRNNLAMIFKQRGSLELAEEHYLIALEAFENALGSNSDEVAALYNNIGGLYQRSGHVDRALEMHQRAYEKRCLVHGEESYEAGQSLTNIAAAYHALGHHQEAAKYYRKAHKTLAPHREHYPEIYQIAQDNYDLLLAEGTIEEDPAEASSENVPGTSSSPLEIPLQPSPAS